MNYKKTTIVQEVTPQQFSKLLSDDIKILIKNLVHDLALKKSGEDLMTRDETCEFLKINSSTLNRWTKEGKIIAHGIGSRKYYKREELIKSLIPVIV